MWAAGSAAPSAAPAKFGDVARASDVRNADESCVGGGAADGSVRADVATRWMIIACSGGGPFAVGGNGGGCGWTGCDATPMEGVGAEILLIGLPAGGGIS